MPKLADYYRIASAARAVGLPRTTLISAVYAGDVPHETLGDGTPVVTLAAAKAYAKTPRELGRPRQGGKN